MTVLQCQSQSHLPRPSLCVHSAKPPSHLSLSNHLSGLSNSNPDNSISLLPCRLCGTFRKSTLYVSRSFTASSKTAFDLFVPRGGAQFHFHRFPPIWLSLCVVCVCVTVCCQICRYLAFLLGREWELSRRGRWGQDYWGEVRSLRSARFAPWIARSGRGGGQEATFVPPTLPPPGALSSSMAVAPGEH